tara:strand:+ start:573 stop:812 length:240 start_codon:yes stop_codon:yes gene_type:complete
VRYNYGKTSGESMAWIELLRSDEDSIHKRKTQYSGTCPKCKEFIATLTGFCPLKLPAEGETSAAPYCPMKVPKDTGDGT